MLGLADEAWVAWDFDSAVFALGRHCEAEVDQVELSEGERKLKNSTAILRRKKRRKLEDLLGIEPKRTPITVAGLAAQGVDVVRRDDERD